MDADTPQQAPSSDAIDGCAKPVVAAICCATRRRPAMLRALLDSWACLEFPPGVVPLFVVVENDTAALNAAAVEEFRSRLGLGDALYLVEPEIGIPYARNAAVGAALSRGAKIICFVDDDETVARDWFMQLHSTCCRTGAQLIGGPVRAGPVGAAASAWRRMVVAGIGSRYAMVEGKARRRMRRPGSKTTIVTNNWFADADLFTAHGLSFDRSLRYSGGSDTKFFRDAVASGVRIAWSPDAIVYETIAPERATLGYQFWRASEQSKNSVRAKILARGRARELPALVLLTSGRLAGMIFLLVAAPFTGGRSLVPLVRAAGWIVGRIAGFLGYSSNLYRYETGF
ncbi:MAG TPA: glycosyltransferase family 2 protein [Rhizobiaceae bacterium]